MDLLLFKAAHETESAALEGNDRGRLLWELLCSVQNGTVASDSENEINILFGVIFGEKSVMRLMNCFDRLLLDFSKSFLVKKIEIDADWVG